MTVPAALEAQLRHVEEDAGVLAERVAELEALTKEESAASRWGALALVARYQRTVRDVLKESEALRKEVEVERAALQVAAADASRRAEEAVLELRAVQARAAEAARAGDEERQRMAARHLASITVGWVLLKWAVVWFC